MLAWLARALEINQERNKLQMNPRLAASHSFFASLTAVLLKLCDPFLEPLSGKAWGKLDPGCVGRHLRTTLPSSHGRERLYTAAPVSPSIPLFCHATDAIPCFICWLPFIFWLGWTEHQALGPCCIRCIVVIARRTSAGCECSPHTSLHAQVCERRQAH